MIVLGIITVHCVFVVGLLMQGCKRTTDEAKAPEATQTDSSTAGIPPVSAPVVQDNSYPSITTPVPAPAPTAATPADIASAPITPAPLTPAMPPADIVPAAPAREHTVVSGDNYYKLATKYNVSVKAITAANANVDPTRLKIGQKLVIPEATAPAAASAPAVAMAAVADAPADSANTYMVKPGDNLTKIANAHGTTVSQLRKINNLRSDRINAGQKLKVPARNATTTTSPAIPTAAAPTAGAADLSASAVALEQ
ncbi:MAG: LysM peptidoglycan-binding domain-containing protein [Verrucomicrobiota bacterium]